MSTLDDMSVPATALESVATSSSLPAFDVDAGASAIVIAAAGPDVSVAEADSEAEAAESSPQRERAGNVLFPAHLGVASAQQCLTPTPKRRLLPSSPQPPSSRPSTTEAAVADDGVPADLLSASAPAPEVQTSPAATSSPDSPPDDQQSPTDADADTTTSISPEAEADAVAAVPDQAARTQPEPEPDSTTDSQPQQNSQTTSQTTATSVIEQSDAVASTTSHTQSDATLLIRAALLHAYRGMFNTMCSFNAMCLTQCVKHMFNTRSNVSCSGFFLNSDSLGNCISCI